MTDNKSTNSHSTHQRLITCVGSILCLTILLVLETRCSSAQDAINSSRIPELNQSAQLEKRLNEDAIVHRVITAEFIDRDNSTPPSMPDVESDQDQTETDTCPTCDSQLINLIARETKNLTSREGTGSSIKLVLLLGALSLAPALLLMTTSYVRIVVVLTLLRQAFGAQQLPPNQVLTALSLFLTLLVMKPVWTEIKTEAIDPYSNSEEICWEEAWQRGLSPVKRFMGKQIEIARNGKSIELFYRYLPEADQNNPPSQMEDIPITVLLPAFIVSELKVAFLLGFQIFLPFLVLDFVVSTVTVSMGMLMLPPTMVSFPLKLILFVMVDGWSLVVGMLLQSFGPFS